MGKRRQRSASTPNATMKARPSDIEIPARRGAWWEIERWDEVYDEDRLWGDLGPEAQRQLTELLRSG
jgi:hypothetical protein